jgi:hypothetical protein
MEVPAQLYSPATIPPVKELPIPNIGILRPFSRPACSHECTILCSVAEGKRLRKCRKFCINKFYWDSINYYFWDFAPDAPERRARGKGRVPPFEKHWSRVQYIYLLFNGMLFNVVHLLIVLLLKFYKMNCRTLIVLIPRHRRLWERK